MFFQFIHYLLLLFIYYSLTEIFPGIAEKGWTSGYQAAMQISGIVVTLSIAIVGGICTGKI
jgi:hypothetical protein